MNGMVQRPLNGLVGREQSLGLLAGALARVAEGTPAVAVVSGETGVGKTSLVREFLSRSSAAVLAGACVPVAGDPLPYAALTQALRMARRDGVVRQELARSPELARLLPGGPAEGRDDAAPGETSRLRMFQSVLGLLDRMGTAQPVVHVVEDVHWADRATLDLLSFLATNLSDERVMLLLTYRSEEIAEAGSLAPWLAELSRLRATDLVPLGRLDRNETAALVNALSAVTPSPELMEMTLARSAGNPLFVEQIVLSGGAPGSLPATLDGLLRARVARLPDNTRDALRALSVIGRVASLPLLARTLQEGEPTIEELLRPAITASVVEVRPDDRVGFHHPAFGEVVYAELMPGARSRLHRAAAEALEPVLGVAPEIVGEVARHWHRAGDLPRAMEASVRAGEASEAMYAFADAQANYLRALQLLRDVPSDLDGVDLQARAAECSMLAGDAAEAIRLIESALTHVRPGRDRAALLERLGTFHFLAGDGAAAELDLREALALLPDSESSVLVARVQAGLGLLAASWSRLHDADVACAESLRISREVGARREEGVTLNALGVVASARGDAEGAIDLLRQALVIAREVESPADVGLGYANLSHVLAVAGRTDESLTLCAEGLEQLRRFGQDRQVGSLMLCNASDALIKAGRFDEAAGLVADALSRQPRGIMAAPVLLLAARLSMTRGDLAEAAEHCEQARRVIESENAPIAWFRELIETSAEAELWAQRPVAALDLVTEGLAAIGGTDEACCGGGLIALGLRSLADDATVRRDPGSRSLRTRQRDVLLGQLERIHADVQDSRPLPETAALDLLCLAELARLDGEPSAAKTWTALGEEWAQIERPFPAAYAAWREAEALLADGVTGRSIEALRTAHEVARALGAQRLMSETRAVATWYRIDLPEQVEPGATEDGLGIYELTSREREVLSALAAGHSNKEIADELFISVKTASVHVSNILRKFDVPSRHDAARIAHRLGVTR